MKMLTGIRLYQKCQTRFLATKYFGEISTNFTTLESEDTKKFNDIKIIGEFQEINFLI